MGLVVKPFALHKSESDLSFFWVAPPPENVPLEYGKPLKMTYSMVRDPCLSQEALEQIDQAIAFAKGLDKRLTNFADTFSGDTWKVTKFGKSIWTKFPKDQDDRLWQYLRLQVLGTEKHNELQPDPLLKDNDTKREVNGHGGEEEEEEIDDVEEEEIDDDEENAIRRRRGYRSVSTNSNGSVTVTPTSSRGGFSSHAISMMLNKQQPVAPMAHGASMAPPAPSNEDDEAPLDFSKPSS